MSEESKIISSSLMACGSARRRGPAQTRKKKTTSDQRLEGRVDGAGGTAEGACAAGCWLPFGDDEAVGWVGRIAGVGRRGRGAGLKRM